jgi:hypothetical protein
MLGMRRPQYVRYYKRQGRADAGRDELMLGWAAGRLEDILAQLKGKARMA